MSWGAGFRVYMGSTITPEKRSSWSAFVLTSQERTVTVERAEYRGLSAAAAASQTATPTWTIISRDPVGPSGQWRVVEELTTYGAWA